MCMHLYTCKELTANVQMNAWAMGAEPQGLILLFSQHMP